MFRITEPLYHKNDNQLFRRWGECYSRACVQSKLNNKLLPHLRVVKKLVHRWRKTIFANTVTLYLMHVICYKNTTVRLEIAQVMNLNL